MAAPAYAISIDPVDRITSDGNDLLKNVEKTVDGVRDTIDSSVDNAGKIGEKVEERVKSERERVEDKKTEFREELKLDKVERKQKLEGRRLAQCQNREGSINGLMKKSANVGKERLAKIQQYETGIKNFYTEQGLSSDAYEAAVALVDERKTAAVAAVDVVEAHKFDCGTMDGAAPSGELKQMRVAKRQALDEYRGSVKALLKVVKDAFEAKNAESDTEGEA